MTDVVTRKYLASVISHKAHEVEDLEAALENMFRVGKFEAVDDAMSHSGTLHRMFPSDEEFEAVKILFKKRTERFLVMARNEHADAVVRYHEFLSAGSHKPGGVADG